MDKDLKIIVKQAYDNVNRKSPVIALLPRALFNFTGLMAEAEIVGFIGVSCIIEIRFPLNETMAIGAAEAQLKNWGADILKPGKPKDGKLVLTIIEPETK